MDRGDRKEEVKRVVEQRDESVFLVERLCLLVDRVHLHGMDAELVGQAKAALESINQEPFAPSLSLDALVYRQASQKDDRDWVSGEFSGRAFGEVLQGNGTRSKCIVAEHLLLTWADRYVGAAQVPLLVLADQPADEFIERRFTAGERIANMGAFQTLDLPLTHEAWRACPSHASEQHLPWADCRVGLESDRGQG